jgi:nucleolar GTP-binding protein
MYKFKEIQTVLQAKDLVDVVLSRTQRKTPTEVHTQFNINRIRAFYMRKVKYAQATFEEKLNHVLQGFPKIDELHPFYADLCNVLYDRDHYKLALGQVKTVLGTVERIAADYNKLLKFADSLYKCKQLKRAGLGRMCTAIRKLQASLQYLEEIRQHMARLPQINPSARTLIVTGYPNVGKSSFVNLITKANVDVQPYAFTTKSIYVGHLDYKLTRWQVLDTPGILDHPLEDRNTIEMTAITALAHIPATILFFLDVSETCGYSIEMQVALFHSIKPLFRNKPLLVVLNKTDARSVESLSESQRALIESLKIEDNVTFLQTSCLTAVGIEDAKNTACDLLLQQRVETKIAQHKDTQIASRIHVTNVVATRPAFIPQSVIRKQEEVDVSTPDKIVTTRHLQEENAGAGAFSVDLRREWKLRDDSWRYDAVPEIMDGMNVADWIDADIDQKLAELEAEEEALMWGDQDDEAEAKQYKEVQKTLAAVHSVMEQQKLENRMKTNHARSQLVRRKNPVKVKEAEANLSLMGVDVESLAHRATVQKRKRTSEEVSEEQIESMDVDGKTIKKKRTTPTSHRVFSSDISSMGAAHPEIKARAEAHKRLKTKRLNQLGKRGEADHFISVAKPRHLFSGKRGIGKNDRR